LEQCVPSLYRVCRRRGSWDWRRRRRRCSRRDRILLIPGRRSFSRGGRDLQDLARINPAGIGYAVQAHNRVERGVELSRDFVDRIADLHSLGCIGSDG